MGGIGLRNITDEDVLELMQSYVPSHTRSFVDDIEAHFGVTIKSVTERLKSIGHFHLYTGACDQYMTQEIFSAVHDLGKDLPEDEHGKIDSGRVRQKEARLKGLVLVAERVARNTWGASVTTDTTIRVEPSAPIDTVIERLGGAKAAREILSGAIGNNC